GRSTAAGVAGGIGWYFLEGLLSTILIAVGSTNPGTMGDFLKAIPEYFLGNNIGALLAEQSHYLTLAGGHASTNIASTIPDWRAWLIIAFYLIVFLIIAWWVSQRHDITN